MQVFSNAVRAKAMSMATVANRLGASSTNSVVIRSYRGACVAATDLWCVAATGLCDAAATFMASSFLTLADWLTYSGVLTFFLTVRKTPFWEPFVCKNEHFTKTGSGQT